MKRLILLTEVMTFFLLAACAGGGGGSAPSTGGSSATIIGYAYTTVQNGPRSNPGNIDATAIYSDGSVDGSPTTVASTDSGGGNLLSVKFSGTYYLFQTNPSANTISSWKVSSAGNSLAKIGSYSPESGCSPESLAVNKTNTVLYLGCGNGGIDTFAINADGSLTALQLPAYNAGSNNAINAMVLDQSGSCLIVNAAVTTTDSKFLQMAIGSGGALTLSASQTGIVGWFPVRISDPSTTNGNYFYAAGSGDTNYYRISESGGTITATQYSSPEMYYWPVWIDQTGTWLTSLNSKANTPQNTYLQQYTIGSSGTLTTNGSPVSINSTWEDSSSPAQYDSTYGFVIMRAENLIIVGAPNSLDGSMSIKGTGTGGYGALAYVPVG